MPLPSLEPGLDGEVVRHVPPASYVEAQAQMGWSGATTTCDRFRVQSLKTQIPRAILHRLLFGPMIRPPCSSAASKSSSPFKESSAFCPRPNPSTGQLLGGLIPRRDNPPPSLASKQNPRPPGFHNGRAPWTCRHLSPPLPLPL